MANIMSMKDIKNHVHRNGFDLTERNCFSAKVGELLPVMCKEVLPGDKFRIDVNSFTRTQPVQTAAFTRINEYYDFYFVPNSLLWDKFNNYIVQTNNYNHSPGFGQEPSTFAYHPYVLSADLHDLLQGLKTAKEQGFHASTEWAWNEVGMARYDGAKKLLEYLGYSNGLINNDYADYSSIAMNIFPLLAYQKIYSDYYRFSQWETSKPYLYNLDYVMNHSDCHINLARYVTEEALRYKSAPFDLRYCNYKKDLLMGLLPNAQFGDFAIAAPVHGGQRFSVTSVNPVNSADLTKGFVANFRDTGSGYGIGSGLGPSVFALRFAEASQKWREVTQSGNLDYKTQLEKHWNVKTSNDQSYMCDYLGGISSPVVINEVVNNNISSEDSKALIAGKGLGGENRHGVVNFEAHEYGYLMCIYHAVPYLDWSSAGAAPYTLKTQASQYAIPEFDNIGMQEVPMSWYDLSHFLLESTKEILGYAPRYIEYKTSVDVVRGAFLTSLKDWVAPIQSYLSDPGLDWRSFKVSPKSLDSIFSPQSSADSSVDSDHLLCTASFGVHAIRNLSVNGLPY